MRRPENYGEAPVVFCEICGLGTRRLPDGACALCVTRAERASEWSRRRDGDRAARARLGFAPLERATNLATWALIGAIEFLAAAASFAESPETRRRLQRALDRTGEAWRELRRGSE